MTSLVRQVTTCQSEERNSLKNTSLDVGSTTTRALSEHKENCVSSDQNLTEVVHPNQYVEILILQAVKITNKKGAF